MASFADANKQLRNHTVGIRSIANDPPVRQIIEETAIDVQNVIDSHNRQGRYFGGAYQNKPYSRNDLPLFFSGQFTIVPRTGNFRVYAPESNRSNVLIKKKDVYWRTSATGTITAYLKGGYATWLRYTRPGKNLNLVDHQYTGQMLNNLDFETTITPRRGNIRVFVRPPHDRKAFYTHIRRNWMGLTRQEGNEIAQRIGTKFNVQIFETIRGARTP